MTKPRPELLPNAGVPVGQIERWKVRLGAPSASRSEMTVTALTDDTEQGRSTRLVAMTTSLMEHPDDEAQIEGWLSRRGYDIDGVTQYTGLARSLFAQKVLADQGHATSTVTTDQVRRIKAVVEMLGEEKALPMIADLYFRSLNTNAEAGVWRAIRAHAPIIANALQQSKRWIKATINTAEYSDVKRRLFDTETDDESDGNGNTYSVRIGAEIIANLATRLNNTMEKVAGDVERRLREKAEIEERESQEKPDLPPKTEAGDGGKLWDKWDFYGIDERSKHPSGSLGRSWSPTSRGSVVGQVSREITDPSSRIFRRRTRGKGGVVVIDCSGSMSLTDHDIERILSTAGGAVVIGYTERRGRGSIYLLADGRRRVRKVPLEIAHGAGNGVDGEALRIGARYHKKGEPFIWVTDGGVCTSTTTASFEALRADCETLIRKERGLYAPNTEGAVKLLQAVGRGATPKTPLPHYWR